MPDTNADPSPRPPPARLPTWAWTIVGAFYGLAMRAAAGLVSSPNHGVMSVAFLIGTPLAVGAISAYGSPKARVSLPHAFLAGLAHMVLMLLGCGLVMLEGLICIAIMSPFFLMLAGVGGLSMGMALRFASLPRAAPGVFALAPLLMMPLDRGPLPDSFHELRETIVIAAPPSVVWQQIVSAKEIHADELPPSLVHFIGVPRPVYAENRNTPHGVERISRWEKGVHFTATVVDQHEFQSISWRYAFAPDSFPAGSMDEHVVPGGRYLDLGETTFELRALPGGSTRLEVVGRYRLTTPINAYAIPVSRLLGRDFLRTLLGLYKGRAEGVIVGGMRVDRGGERPSFPS